MTGQAQASGQDCEICRAIYDFRGSVKVQDLVGVESGDWSSKPPLSTAFRPD